MSLAKLSTHERAKTAARARWGPQRVVRLDELDADTGRLIRALLAQTKDPTVSETSVESLEDDGVGRRAPTAA